MSKGKIIKHITIGIIQAIILIMIGVIASIVS